MGNCCACLKKRDQALAKVRRVYIGKDCPMLKEDVEGDVTVARTSRQTFAEPTNKHAPEFPQPIPVRRQSFVGPTAPKQRAKAVYPSNLVRSSRYTAWSFLPQNLFEQFRRVVNFYFLIVAILQSILKDSPVSPVTAVVPLVFVITVTMVKQGYEDWLRHKADNEFNNRPVKVIRDGMIEVIKSKDIRVGDILKLEGEEHVPTDLLFIASSDEFQRCQINTANLDGETNLKMRYCPAGLPHFRDESDFLNFNVAVEYEQPCEDLYSFNGNVLIPQYDTDRKESSLMTVVEDSGSHHTTDDQSLGPNPGTPLKQEKSSNPSGINREGRSNRSIDRVVSTKSRITYWGVNQSPGAGTFTDWMQVVIGMENMILRGTRLKNTDYIYGIVLYTGPDTRLARNSTPTGTKFSTVEKSVNKYLVVFIVLLVILVVSSMVLSITVEWYPADSWYLGETQTDTKLEYYFNLFGAFLVLYNYIIPISLYVTIELQKFLGSKFFVWDAEMSADDGTPPLCNTSDLNEELGQIQYLFSDKTGTLTENVMKFRLCCIASTRYDYEDAKLYRTESDDQSKRSQVDVRQSEDVVSFLRTLALCHSVQVMPMRRPSVESSRPDFLHKKKKLSSKIRNANSLFVIGDSGPDPMTISAILGGTSEYQASSPDEKALVEACLHLGVVFKGENEEKLTVDVCGNIETYKRHLTLEFDSNRKCMSVVIEDENGEIKVLTKGADSSVLPKCDFGPTQDIAKHIQGFAMMGLRTLIVAERKLTVPQLNDYITKLKAARRLIRNREEKIREIYTDIESHLTAIGATGVEDQLQEGVQQTLAALGAAGIRVWMLTGDKLETGENVAVSCGLITTGTTRYYLTDHGDEDDAVIEKLKQIQGTIEVGDNTVLIIDGEALAVTLRECPAILSEVAMKAFRVVCVRMTPLQKAQVVRMVRDTPGNPTTCAVGDGANDVAMIQEAHIGIGILGKEGRQAARSADFALAKFGFLRKAILVHGHWYYVRLANLANYFFYKNVLFIMPQIFYCFHSSFSTQALFDSIFLMMYNIFHTSCPILFYGLLEQPYPKKDLMERPHLYKEISRNSLMKLPVFLKWTFFAVWHAACSYWFVHFAWPSYFPIADLASYGTAVFCSLVTTANLKILLETRFMTGYTVFSHACSYSALFGFTAIYSEADLTSIYIQPHQMRNVYFALQRTAAFWIVLLVSTYTAILPDLICRSVQASSKSISRFFKSLPLPFCNKSQISKRSAVRRIPGDTAIAANSPPTQQKTPYKNEQPVTSEAKKDPSIIVRPVNSESVFSIQISSPKEHIQDMKKQSTGQANAKSIPKKKKKIIFA